MKILAGTGLAVLLALPVMAPAAERDLTRLFTHPRLPPQAALDRLNLVLGWRTYVPMDGRRDALLSVQLSNGELIVTTRSGLITVLDAETGVTRWRARVGNTYQVNWPPAHNSRGVFVVNANYLYALDRNDGSLQWRFTLPSGASAPPVADEERVFVPTAGGRLYAYFLPRGELRAVRPPTPLADTRSANPGDRTNMTGNRAVSLYGTNRKTTGAISHLSSVRQAGQEIETGPHPVPLWNSLTHTRMEMAPVLTHDMVLAVSPTGTSVALAKNPRGNDTALELYRFRTGELAAPAGRFGDVAYLGSRDDNLYALNVLTGRLDWRYTAGTDITRRPVTTDQDVYVTSEGGGLARLDRETGEPLWRVPRGREVLTSNPDADRFLAANPKFVYAMDPRGRMLVLDRKRGVQLSAYDLRDYVFPVVNETNDRIYLAANDGLLVCLHDREYGKPFRQRTQEEALADAVKKALTQVTEGSGKKVRLSDLLDTLQTRFKGLKFQISNRAFAEAGRDPIGPALVTLPKGDKVPLSQILQKVLAQVGAEYQIVEDAILIVPAKRTAAPAPAPAPAEK